MDPTFSSSCRPESIETCRNNNGENIMIDVEWKSIESEVSREFNEIFADMLKGCNGREIPLNIKVHPPNETQPSPKKMNGYQPNLPTVQEENGNSGVFQFYPVIPVPEGDGFIILNTPMSFCKGTNQNDHHFSCTIPSYTTTAEGKNIIDTSSKVQVKESQVKGVQVLPLENMNELGKELENDIIKSILADLDKDIALDEKKNVHEISTLPIPCATTSSQNSNQEEELLKNNISITTSSQIQELDNNSSSLFSSLTNNTQINDTSNDSDSTSSTLKAMSSFELSDSSKLEEFNLIDTSSTISQVDDAAAANSNSNNDNIEEPVKVDESKKFESTASKIESTEDTESGYNSSQHSSPSSQTQTVQEPPALASSLPTSNNKPTVENVVKPGRKSKKRKLPDDFEGIVGVNLNFEDGSTEHTPLDMPLNTRKSGRARKPPGRFLSADVQSVIKDKYQQKLEQEEKRKVQKVKPISMMKIKKEIIDRDEESIEQPAASTILVKKARRGRPKKVTFSV